MDRIFDRKSKASALNLDRLPLLDTHCHLFDLEYQDRDLSEVFSLSLEHPPSEQRRQTLFYHWFIKELAAFLGCSSVEEKEVMAARAERIKRDYSAYVRDLFNQANILGLLADVGYKPAAVSLEAFHELVCKVKTYYPAVAGVETFHELAPVQVKYLYRIETVLDKLWGERASFHLALESFDEALHEAITRPHFIGLKSIIGYRTGLAVEKVSEEEARLAYAGGREKAVRDFFLHRALKFCRKGDLPIQLHTGFGESNNNLLLNNPLLLKPMLEDEEIKQQRIVLVHGGYPYSFETGYLCAMYPQVYCDVSAFVPLVPLGMSKGLADIMDMCPLNKIMYGSDAFILPEFNWFAAVIFKRKLKLLLTDMIEQAILDEKCALEVAEMIAYKNGAKFYGFNLELL